MLRNKMDLMGGILNGLNLNPISLEFGQEMTTTKWLYSLLAKIDEVINFTNGWYDSIIDDLEKEGILFDKLSEKILSEINVTINQLNTDVGNINSSITAISEQIALLGYVEPTVSMDIAPTQTVYNKGEAINSVILNFNVVKGSNDLLKAEVYRNNSLIATVNNISNGNNTFVDGTVITSDTSYYIKIFDNKKVVQSNEIDIHFISDYYYGVASINNVINQSFIKSLSFVKDVKQNLTEEFNVNNQKVVFAYPQSYGDLLSIMYDDMNYLDSFDKSIIMIDNVNYNVYTSINYLSDLFKIAFNIMLESENITSTPSDNLDGGLF
jgi:hypothetical protein